MKTITNLLSAIIINISTCVYICICICICIYICISIPIFIIMIQMESNSKCKTHCTESWIGIVSIMDHITTEYCWFCYWWYTLLTRNHCKKNQSVFFFSLFAFELQCIHWYHQYDHQNHYHLMHCCFSLATVLYVNLLHVHHSCAEKELNWIVQGFYDNNIYVQSLPFSFANDEINPF